MIKYTGQFQRIEFVLRSTKRNVTLTRDEPTELFPAEEHELSQRADIEVIENDPDKEDDE